jgi:hypothetical protein
MDMSSSYICSIYEINRRALGVRVYTTIIYTFIQGPDLSKTLSTQLKYSGYIPAIYSKGVFKINVELV